MKNKQAGFTVIEIIVVVLIISIVVTIGVVGVNQSRKNARISGIKTSLKTTLPVIISCKDSGGTVNVPSGSETGVTPICNTIPDAFWPKLNYNYRYGGGVYNANNCSFQVLSGNDAIPPHNNAYLTCDCNAQACR